MYGCCSEPSNSIRTLFGESDGETSSRATQSAGNGISVIKRSVRTVVSLSKNQFLFGRHPISSKCAIISYRPADFSVHSWHDIYDRSRSRGVRSAAAIPASNAEYWNFKLFLFNLFQQKDARKKMKEKKKTRRAKRKKKYKFNQIFKFHFDELLWRLTNLRTFVYRLKSYTHTHIQCIYVRNIYTHIKEQI